MGVNILKGTVQGQEVKTFLVLERLLPRKTPSVWVKTFTGPPKISFVATRSSNKVGMIFPRGNEPLLGA
jgi:hypothetical protein